MTLKTKFLFAMTLFIPSFFSLATSISIATNQWAPYINGEHKPLGTAADILKQVLGQKDISVNWRYQNYDLTMELVANNKQPAAFPYFKNPERENRVLFSQPIFSVTNRVYYNRQRETALDLSKLNGHKFGKVSGYSYGKVIDTYAEQATIYATENDALEGLFNNEIDFLPMTESVMNTMLNDNYRDQALLIKQVEAIEMHNTLHLIAPKTEDGQALIATVDTLLEQVRHIESFKQNTVERYKPKDIAKLVTAEGYPAIIGQTTLNGMAKFYTIPQGTKVLVLNWSDKILKSSPTDRIYRSMIDLSFVVVLNGPHVAKELYIKNMHLEVQ